MSTLDASFLHAETDAQPLHVGSLTIFQGPMPSYAEVAADIAGRLPAVPRYRQVPRMVPLHLDHPVWEDDAHFRLEYHLRHTALPAPGGRAQLRALAGRVMGQRLDRSKPLWEIWMIEGLEQGRWALLGKTHHCMVDGVSGIDLLATLLDPTPEPADPTPDDWAPAATAGPWRLAADAVAHRARASVGGLRSAVSLARDPKRLAMSTAVLARGTARYAPIARPLRSPLNATVGPHRVYAWASGSLADVKAIKAALGGTVNDVVLAAVTSGLRDLLTSRGIDPDGHQVRTLVPVSVRSPEEQGGYNNRVSAMVAELPVGLPHPVERLREIQAQMQGLKQSGQAVAGDILVGLSGFAPAILLALGGRAGARIQQRNVQLVTTNIPGPQLPLYLLGRELLECYPYVPVANNLPQSVGVFSYNGMLTFGVTGDADTAPDVDVLARGIEAGLTELGSAAKRMRRRRP